jgi:hypothetical protein
MRILPNLHDVCDENGTLAQACFFSADADAWRCEAVTDVVRIRGVSGATASILRRAGFANGCATGWPSRRDRAVIAPSLHGHRMVVSRTNAGSRCDENA